MRPAHRNEFFPPGRRGALHLSKEPGVFRFQRREEMEKTVASLGKRYMNMVQGEDGETMEKGRQPI